MSNGDTVDDPVSRFRLSIRLEASRRVLRKEWWRQLVVWVMSFMEVSTIAVIPGLHLVTSHYIMMAVVIFTLLLSCLRARNILDPFWHPVHVLRPKHYSRFGLGEHQRDSTVCAMTSLTIRLCCSVAFTLFFLLFVVWRVEPMLCTERSLSAAAWAEYYRPEIQSDLDWCRGHGHGNSSRCHILADFDNHCHDPVRWSQHLRKQALDEFGVACVNKTSEELLKPFIEQGYVKTEYCIYDNGTEVDCDEDAIYDAEYDLSVWTIGKISLDQACGSWPAAPFEYYCNIFFEHTNYCSTTPAVNIPVWGSILSRSCELHACAAVLPNWLQDLLIKSEQLNLCDCRSCKHWSRSNICVLEEVHIAHRRLAGLDDFAALDLAVLLQDPTYTAQLFAAFLMVVWPSVWCLAAAVFYCGIGNPFGVPSNLELEERISAEELALRDELRSNGCIAKAPLLNRFLMLMELAWFLTDVVLDIEMFALYLATQHYWFAATQGFIVLRTMVDLTFRRSRCSPWHIIQEIVHSFWSNLRTDFVLSVLQSEKTGEAVLSLFLQTYALFYMGSEASSYWTACLSLVTGAGGIAYGCYIHFDLAIVFEGYADVVPSDTNADQVKLIPSVKSMAPSDEPPMMQVASNESENAADERTNNQALADEMKPNVSETMKVKAAQTVNSKGDGVATLIGASSSFSIIIPGSSSTFSNPGRRRSA